MCGTLMWRQAPDELPFCSYLQLFLLEIKAELENVESIKVPRGATFTITVRFRLAGLRAAHERTAAPCMRAQLHAVMQHEQELHGRVFFSRSGGFPRTLFEVRSPPQVTNSSGEDTQENVTVLCSSGSHYCLGTAELQSQVRFQALLDVRRR